MTRLHSTLRVIVGIVAVLIFAAGFLVIAAGGADAPAGIWALVVGGVGIIAVVLDRNRYRSEAAERAGAPTGPGGGEEGPL